MGEQGSRVGMREGTIRGRDHRDRAPGHIEP
jgi:hypothetical protein